MHKHPQHTRITHVNSTGLDPFSFAVKDSALKKGGSKKEKTGRWEGVGVALFSQMKWKAHVAAICQSKQRVQRWVRLLGDLFFFTTMFPLKLHGAREGVEEKKGWCSTAEVRKMDILTERGGDFKQLHVFPFSALVWYAASLPNSNPISRWGQKRHSILKSESDRGQSSVAGMRGLRARGRKRHQVAGRSVERAFRITAAASICSTLRSPPITASLQLSVILSLSIASSPSLDPTAAPSTPVSVEHRLPSQFNHRLKMTAGADRGVPGIVQVCVCGEGWGWVGDGGAEEVMRQRGTEVLLVLVSAVGCEGSGKGLWWTRRWANEGAGGEASPSNGSRG